LPDNHLYDKILNSSQKEKTSFLITCRSILYETILQNGKQHSTKNKKKNKKNKKKTQMNDLSCLKKQ